MGDRLRSLRLQPQERLVGRSWIPALGTKRWRRVICRSRRPLENNQRSPITSNSPATAYWLGNMPDDAGNTEYRPSPRTKALCPPISARAQNCPVQHKQPLERRGLWHPFRAKVWPPRWQELLRSLLSESGHQPRWHKSRQRPPGCTDPEATYSPPREKC